MEQELNNDQKRQWKHVSCSRIITVICTACIACAVALGMVIADIYDVIPGPLTLRPVAERSIEAVPTMQAAAQVIGNADLLKGIDGNKAQELITQLRSAEGIGSDISVAVMQADGTMAAEYQSDTAREPASTLKTLTALAAASVLDMGATFTTETYFVQESNGTNTLILKGNGDMLLGSGESDSHHVNGRAGLTTLAKETAYALKQRAITTVALSYDDSLFGQNRYPDNIEQNNGDNLYYTGVSSMAIDGGRQREQALSNPDNFSDYPELSQHTAIDTVQRFSELLQKQGIAVSNNQYNELQVPANRTALASVESAPLSSVMAFMLQHSDNTLAEEFGRLLALHENKENSPQGAVDAVTDVIASLGITTEGLHMADCSGLSPGSRVSVHTLVEVQQRNTQPGLAVAAAEGLSVPGLIGTARTRLASPAAAGLMRVKTGSLSTVTSMTGNISRINGGVVTFSVIVNNPTDITQARDAIDTFIAQLAKL